MTTLLHLTPGIILFAAFAIELYLIATEDRRSHAKRGNTSTEMLAAAKTGRAPGAGNQDARLETGRREEG